MAKQDAHIEPDIGEKDRLAALTRYQILDTPIEKQFDDLVALASHICGTPIALITLLDDKRQWFKSKIGIEASETPREIAACDYTIRSPDLFVVPNTENDDRFKNNPLVTGDPNLRFYAGAPLITPEGFRIGALCVLDTEPRELNETQKSALKMLSDQVITLLELRLALHEKDETARHLAHLKRNEEQALERINLALDSGTVLGTWVWDIKADHITGDERFSRTFNIDPDSLRAGIPIARAFGSIHRDDIERVREHIDNALQNGGKFRCEYRVSERDRGWVWVEANGRVELDADGNPVRFPGVLIDVDDNKKLELAIEASSKKYQMLFNSIDEGFCILEIVFDGNGKAVDYIYIETNPAFEAHSGLKKAEGLNVRSIVGNHEEHWFTNYGNVVKTGGPTRFTDYAEQFDRWFDVYAFKLPEDDNPNRIAVIFSDVTTKIKSDIALRESEERLSLMVESAQDFLIISTSKEGIITTWNSGAERIFGYLQQDTIGKHISMIFTDEDRNAGAAEMEMAIAREKGRANDERWHKRKNGERFYASGIMAAMRNDNGDLTGYVKIARDMTAQQRHQEMLLEARNAAEAANIAKSEFLANMSHEIRTPMNAIIGLSNILSMSEPLSPKQSQFIKTLQMSADSLLALINDLLDISKIEARSVDLEQIPFSITQIVQETISMMAVRVREKGLSFTASGDCIQNRSFIGDPTRFRQVILNLCSNAIKFTESGGIHVSVTCTPSSTPDVETICIEVKDTGIGISPDKIDTIFQKFVQADTSINRKYGGTGLGLAITKTITEIMGGTIDVKSELGKGSTFTISIPLRMATDVEVAGTDLSLEQIVLKTFQRPIKPVILLVEDYEPNVIVASTILETYGFEVDVAVNGIQAVDKVKEKTYAVVLMDVQMHGMNGFEATSLIRSREAQNGTPRTPIIGMTAHALSGDRERCIGAGMDEYISKPFNPQELKEMIESFIPELPVVF